jgi:hypothetical protein
MVGPNGPASVMLLIFKGSSGMVMVNAIGGLGRSLEMRLSCIASAAAFRAASFD